MNLERCSQPQCSNLHAKIKELSDLDRHVDAQADLAGFVDGNPSLSRPNDDPIFEALSSPPRHLAGERVFFKIALSFG
jgi:hypothetical protein